MITIVPKASAAPTTSRCRVRTRRAASSAPASEPIARIEPRMPYSPAPLWNSAVAIIAEVSWKFRPKVPAKNSVTSTIISSGRRHRYRIPSRIMPLSRPAGVGEYSSCGRIRHSDSSTAEYVSPLTMITGPVPNQWISRPARPGPISRAALNEAEFSPTAFGRSSRPTISTTNDWRVGASNAVPTPNRKASAKTCHTVATCVTASRPRASDTRLRPSWVSASTRRFGNLSAIRPAYGESSSAGRNCRPVTMPSAVPEPVSSRTSQSWATRIIQVPTFDTIAPDAYRRKLRTRNALKVGLTRTPVSRERVRPCAGCHAPQGSGSSAWSASTRSGGAGSRHQRDGRVGQLDHHDPLVGLVPGPPDEPAGLHVRHDPRHRRRLDPLVHGELADRQRPAVAQRRQHAELVGGHLGLLGPLPPDLPRQPQDRRPQLTGQPDV